MCVVIKKYHSLLKFFLLKNSKELAAWLPASYCKINSILLLGKITVGCCLLKTVKNWQLGCQQVTVKLTVSYCWWNLQLATVFANTA